MTDKLVCSFCGASQDHVDVIIAGPSVNICDGCVDIANDCIKRHKEQNPVDSVLAYMLKRIQNCPTMALSVLRRNRQLIAENNHLREFMNKTMESDNETD